MARAPRSTIPRTSGQGITRLSYQKARDMRGADKAPSIKVQTGASADSGGRDRYAKAPKLADSGTMNVDYANTFVPRNLQGVEAMGVPPPKTAGVKLGPTSRKRLK